MTKRGAEMKKNYMFHIWLQTGSERNNGEQVVATGQSRNQGDGTLKHRGAGTDQQQETAAMQHKGRRSQQQGPARLLRASDIFNSSSLPWLVVCPGTMSLTVSTCQPFTTCPAAFDASILGLSMTFSSLPSFVALPPEVTTLLLMPPLSCMFCTSLQGLATLLALTYIA
ncbi:hypothetical protein FRX31_014139 [Thalictrum thalictroides]|uniref:Uncharacterized protein n=1 Tax=Thalictrum thalictroides TaxID=46969 RepID=A0A7J6WH30_THATH|nr:hypothetical protein FRX31_014139 [Thalictrum thalictroides]